MLSIIGKGRGWEEAPYGGECWGITQLILRRPVSLVIDMNVYHDDRWGEQERLEADQARLLAAHSCVPYIDLSNYPLGEIIGEFGTDYFSNTVDYALALAIMRGYKEIHLYGVNMATNGEYAYQKPGVEFWCGVAIGRGIKLSVHGNQSTIMKTCDGKVYGYDTVQKGIVRWQEQKEVQIR